MSAVRIRVPDEATAQAISRGLYRLSRPEAVSTAAKDDTLYFCEFGANPDGSGFIVVDDAWELPVHAQIPEQMADPKDTSGSRALMGHLFAAIAKDAGSLGRLVTLLSTSKRLRISAVLAEVNPKQVTRDA